MSLRFLPLNLNPDHVSDFAQIGDESVHPEMWNGLVGAWIPFLGVTGFELIDRSGRGNHAPFNNMEIDDWVIQMDHRGVSDYAINIDNFEDITIPDPIVSGYPFTVLASSTVGSSGFEGWFDIAHSGSNNINYSVGINANKARLFVRDGVSGDVNLDGTDTLTTDTWHQIVGIFRHNTSRDLFVDGLYDKTGTTNVSFNGNVDRAGYGWLADSSPGFRNTGNEGHVLVYNRELDPGEILWHYNNPKWLFVQKHEMLGFLPAAAANLAAMYYRTLLQGDRL